ncbi:MAG: flavin reductase (DIM6/NTAB) family NADH-FMN oxidoreductase RutF [Algoriphagus sp.]|jgi:flavin reductase (DIM6/NTAB) family NADH-FMN oxidoreductase RutF
MKYINRSEIDSLEHVYKLNLVNSCTGYKSANLIGTISEAGIENVAVFSSVIHMGSSPPLLGFVTRHNVQPKDTLANIKASGFYTINHISNDIVKEAHQTSANYPSDLSEFEETGLLPQYKDDFMAPFVAESPVQIAMKIVEEVVIKKNNTILVLGEIIAIYVKDEILQSDGYLDLSKGHVASINGVDGYCLPKPLGRFDYAKPNLNFK